MVTGNTDFVFDFVNCVVVTHQEITVHLRSYSEGNHIVRERVHIVIMDNSDGSTYRSCHLDHHFDSSPTSPVECSFHRALTPSCLVTLHSSTDPIEYITSPDLSFSSLDDVNANNCIRAYKHVRNSTDTLGDSLSNHFNSSTFDSFDARFILNILDPNKDSIFCESEGNLCLENNVSNSLTMPNVRINANLESGAIEPEKASCACNALGKGKGSEELRTADSDSSSLESSPCRKIFGKIFIYSSC